jgi:hypothetical protein
VITFGGLHLGPILLAVTLIVDLGSVVYLAWRINVLERCQRRIAGLMALHGWTTSDDAPVSPPQ